MITAVLRRRVSPVLLRRGAVGVAAVAGLLLVVAALRAASGEWLSTGDNAAIEMRVRDVGSSDTPVLGAYSRFGFLYPGPLLFWVLAVPYRLVGASSLFAAAGLLSALTVGAVVLVGRRSRHNGFALVATLLVLLLARAQGVELLDPWNPWVPVCWLVVLFLVSWRIALGEVQLLPVGALLTSFLVQSHLQYSWPSLVLVLWSTAAGAHAAWAAAHAADADTLIRARRSWWRTAVLLAAVVLVSWMGPMVDHLTSESSNMSRIVAFVTAGDDPNVDPMTYDRGEALREVGYAVRPLAPWTTGVDHFWIRPTGRDVVWLTALGTLVIALSVRLRRAGEREAAALLTAAGLVVVGAYLQVLGLRGPPTQYLVRFLWPVAACLWLAILWGAWRALPGRWRVLVRTPAAFALFVLLAGALLGLGGEVLAEHQDSADALLIEDVGPELLDVLPDDEVVSVRHRGALGFMPLAMTLYLEREGQPVAVGEPYRQIAGDSRVGREPDTVVTVVEGYGVDAWLAQSDAGVDGLELVALRESALGAREHSSALEARRALLACDVRTEAEVDRALSDQAYGSLREAGMTCPDAIRPIDEAERAMQASIADGRWGRYAVFIQPIESLRR